MNIRKRSGELVNYDRNRVVNAVFAAMKNVGQPNRQIAIEIADEATSIYQDHSLTSVEELQDVVEELLMQTVPQVAKEYILHRDKRSKERNKKRMTPHVLTPQKLLTEKFLKPYFKNPNPFPTQLGEFVYYRTYARAIAAEQRRETWAETVERVVEFSATLELNAMQQKGIQITPAYLAELRTTAEKMYDLMYNFKLFPSGRSLFVGGTESSFASSISNFNCSFLAVDEIEKFSELFLVLMLGTGAGLSLEKNYTQHLPKVNSRIEIIHQDYRPVAPLERKEFTSMEDRGHGVIDITIGDSRFGWAKAIEYYFNIITSKQYENVGFIVFNYDNVRPKGERLKTFGGFASGHGALKTILDKIDTTIHRDKKDNKWKTLSSLDCLDIATSIAEGVVAGGVRRSSLILFCDKEDEAVLNAKQNLYSQDASGGWVMDTSIANRTLSNNTVMYKEKPTYEELKKHFELIKVSAEPKNLGGIVILCHKLPFAGNPLEI